MPTEDNSDVRDCKQSATLHPIQALLIQSYGTTWPNRHRRGVEAPVRVDDQNDRDFDGRLPKITVMTAGHDDDECILRLDDTIQVVLNELRLRQCGAKIVSSGGQWSCCFHVRLSDLETIRSLATAVSAVTAPGRQYDYANLRWICPRTATSLYRLADELDELAPERDEDSEDYFS